MLWQYRLWSFQGRDRKLERVLAKGGFFSESAIGFSNLQISKKKYSKKTTLNLKFKFPANKSSVIGGKFKFQEYFFLEI